MGSSESWPPEESKAFGPLSSSAAVNPDFFQAHHVHVKYCDGASFSGDTTLHHLLPGTSSRPRLLHFRGRRILDEVIRTLIKAHGLGAVAGTEVLLTGCSAGGLATILAADRVLALLPSTVTKFKAAPGSGFFLDERSALTATHVYASQMRRLVDLQNLSASLSAECRAAQPEGEAWRCVLAQHAAPFVRSPLFFMDSGSRSPFKSKKR